MQFEFDLAMTATEQSVMKTATHTETDDDNKPKGIHFPVSRFFTTAIKSPLTGAYTPIATTMPLQDVTFLPFTRNAKPTFSGVLSFSESKVVYNNSVLFM